MPVSQGLCSATLGCHNINTRRYSLDPGPDHTPTLYTVTALNQALFCQGVMKKICKIVWTNFLTHYFDEMSFLTVFWGTTETTMYYIFYRQTHQ